MADKSELAHDVDVTRRKMLLGGTTLRSFCRHS
jgi:hypothetical protein